ncbi:MAG TPA: beta-galactosidase [Limnochordia bacterium]
MPARVDALHRRQGLRWMWLAAVLCAASLLAGAAPPAAAAGAGIMGQPQAREEHNLLQSGDFSSAGARTHWQLPAGAELVWDAALEHSVLRVNAPNIAYIFARQDIALPAGSTALIVSALVRLDDVRRGANPWDTARIHLTFHDENGRQLGGWPDAGLWTGTHGWRWYNRHFDVPPGATRVSLYAGLHNAAGTVWFGQVIAEARDASGKPLARVTAVRNETEGWIPFRPAPEADSPTAVDMSRLLEAPAGQHGFLRVQGDGFVFEDGTPARFFGVNVVAGNAFPDHATAERMAERLAKFGVNLVRFHHMDAPWASPNIFDPRASDTQHLSETSLDRLDYLVYQLKQRGIYVFFDLLVHRKFKPGDRVRDSQLVENGAKVVAHFNERIIELQKVYATQLLTHRNPYTGLRYVDDPVVVLVDVINESSLFWAGGLSAIPPSYAAELDRLWNSWLIETYDGRAGLAEAWGSELAADEDPAAGTVERPVLSAEIGPLRRRDLLRFYYQLQSGHYRAMRDHLRRIGLKVPLAGSNFWERAAVDLLSNADGLDFIDRHAYWDHPQGGYGWNVSFNNNAAVHNPEGSIVSSLARAQVAGMPFTVSEWQHAWPNEFVAEGPLTIAAYALLQGWDALMQFEFAGATWGNRIEGNFDIGNKPHVFGLWPAVALMFHRGDVSEAEREYTFPVPAERVWSGGSYDVIPAGLPLVSRVALDLGSEQGAPPDLRAAEAHIDRERMLYTSDTGELRWDGEVGVLVVDTPGTQGAVGFLGERDAPLTLTDVRIEVETPFAAVIVSALEDGKRIGEAKRLLLTAVARAENSGTVYNPTRTRLIDPGTAPILMEPVVARILLDGREAAFVYPLDSAGRRQGEPIEAEVTPAGVSFEISGQAPIWYEIVVGE